MDKIITMLFDTENVRTIFIVLIIFLATYSKKDSQMLDMKAIRADLKKMADWLEVRIKKPSVYKSQMEEKALDGMSYFCGCPILRDILWFKMVEFIDVVHTIHIRDWHRMNQDWVANLLTNSADKVSSYILEATKDGCSSCFDYYEETHNKRTEDLINTINEIVIDDVNNKGERLHYKALNFIHETISMFYKMEKICPKVDTESIERRGRDRRKSN